MPAKKAVQKTLEDGETNFCTTCKVVFSKRTPCCCDQGATKDFKFHYNGYCKKCCSRAKHPFSRKSYTPTKPQRAYDKLQSVWRYINWMHPHTEAQNEAMKIISTLKENLLRASYIQINTDLSWELSEKWPQYSTTHGRYKF